MGNRRRALLILGLAMVLGLAAAWASLNYLQNQGGPVLPTVNRTTTPVAVAVTDLPLGSMVRPEDVQLIDWPSEQVPVGYVTAVEDVVGRGLVRAVSVNEPFLEAKLADTENGGLPITIPEGMRAISIRVDEVVSVAGFVVPGTRVDVILTVDPPRGGDKLSQVVLQDILALTSGQLIEADDNGSPVVASVITVLVTPEQAEQLVIAGDQGRIQLALRNTLDGDSIRTDGARVEDLLTGRRRRASGRATTRVAPVEQAPTIEILKGGQRTIQRF
ncbi:MAG: Flp pilus assembly protein CpaB [Gemmatimonadota bacterium]